MSNGPSTSNAGNTTPSTRSRIVLSQTPASASTPSTPADNRGLGNNSSTATAGASSANSSVTTTPPSSKTPPNQSLTPAAPFPPDEKLFSKYSSCLIAETNRRKTEIQDHNKRLAELRKEAEQLELTDWMYEPIEKLLGK